MPGRLSSGSGARMVRDPPGSLQGSKGTQDATAARGDHGYPPALSLNISDGVQLRRF